MKYDPHKSSLFDLDANIAAVLVYVLPWLLSIVSQGAGSVAWVIPLIALMMETKSRFVTFHSANALAFFVMSAIIDIIAAIIGLGTALTSWLSNIWVLGIFYLGIQGIVVLVLALVFLCINIYFLVGKVLSLVKAYDYQEFEYPLISKITHLILSMKK